MLQEVDALALDEPYHGPPATVHVLPLDSGDVAPRWMEIRVREYLFRLAYDPYADPRRSGHGARIALSGYMAQQLIGADVRESLVAIYFDAEGRMLGFCNVARGSGNVCYLTPADVLTPALRLDAKAVIVAHNHPAGSTAPSCADWDLAEQMALGMEAFGVRLLASLVVTTAGWRSHWEASDSQVPEFCGEVGTDALAPDPRRHPVVPGKYHKSV